MSAVAQQRYTYDEYLVRERVADTKSEYFGGQIFAMAGGSPRHNSIGVNLVASLKNRLRGSPCRPFNSDQRIRISASGLATYPDVSIICGELQLDAQDADAIVNPRVIFEVLSKSTEGCDRGKKFDFFRQIDSLSEYVLVSQEDSQVECFTLQSDGNWLLSITKGLSGALRLSTVLVELPLVEIYEDIVFSAE